MRLNDYQQATRKTAIYPTKDALLYTGIGIADEAIELIEKIVGGDDGPAKRADILGEIGDVFWYIARASDEMKIPLQDIADKMTWPKPEQGQSAYMLFLAAAGKYLGKIKKIVRGDDIQKEDLEPLLCKVYGLLLRVMNELSIYGDEAMENNLNKLASRKKRGKLKGDGDNR